MDICLVGADFEENLALGLLAAVVEQAGHAAHVLPLNGPAQASEQVERIVAMSPGLVGLSIQFQHRADEFLSFARALRTAGYRGHITVGGHFPTMAFADTLEGGHGVDSVVLYDGEQTLPELMAALATGACLGEVPGLALLRDDGVAYRTVGRRLTDDLDALPFAKRYRSHTRHCGVPFIPILGGRGCWGECAFCSIMTVYRQARREVGGRLVRLRSVESLAAEMALLWHGAGGASIFCFHDDNMLLPRPQDSLARLRALREKLDEYGVGKIGIVGKCRPETLDAPLARELAALGVIRLYVGVENTSPTGAAHLGRAVQQRAVRQALDACEQAGIFACYNLLVFEPDATLDDVRDNVRFMREHAELPVNFCRAEPYVGTPLARRVAERQELGGTALGWNYRIVDDRTELAHRICSAAFALRNFSPDGVANRYMGLGYGAKLLEHFYADGGDAGARAEVAALTQRARRLTRQITLDTADYIERALDLAEHAPLDDWDAVERHTALLALEVGAADRGWHRRLDDLLLRLTELGGRPARPSEPPRPTAQFLTLKRSVALGLSLAAIWTACDGDTSGPGPVLVDPVVGGFGGAVDPAPGGFGGGVDPAPGGFGGAVDPAPGGFGGMGGVGGAVDPAPGGFGGMGGVGGAVDPAPGGFGGANGDADHATLLQPYEPSPAFAPCSTPAAAPRGDGPRERRAPSSAARQRGERHALGGQWTNSAAQRVRLTADLPLYDPPRVRLHASRTGDAVQVVLEAGGAAVTTRWEAEGEVVADAQGCLWRPRDGADRLHVAIRSHGGVALFSLRADEIDERA